MNMANNAPANRKEESGKRKRDDECEADTWDLPLPLAAKIVSYSKVWTTIDVAKLREVSRSFGQVIRSQISAKTNVSHTIECPGRLKHEKSFVSGLNQLGRENDGGDITVGDMYSRAETHSIQQLVFCGNDSTADVICERIFLVEGPYESVNLSATTITSSKDDGDDGRKEALSQEIKDMVSLMENSQSIGKLESLCEDAKSRGLFEPINIQKKKVPVASASDDESEDDSSVSTGSIELGEYFDHFGMFVAIFDIPEDSECIMATTDSYLEVQTDDFNQDLTLDMVGRGTPFAPVSMSSTFVAPIMSERTEVEGGRKVYRVCVLLEGTCDKYYYDMPGKFSSSLRFELLKNQHQNRIGPVEGVVIVDDFLGEDLVQTLTSNIDSLATHQKDQNTIDYHPHSNGVVRDIVHPGLYSYIQGVTELRASVKDVKPCTFSHHSSREDDKSNSPVEDDGYGQGIVEVWGRNEWDKYQWLPTYFDISAEGDCKIEDYINGLTPRDSPINANLHQSLAQLFENALPYINSVYSYTRTIRPLMRAEQEYDRSRLEIGKLNILPYNLKGNGLQVITKIVDYELKPGQSHEGVWHVEGMSQEDIVLTVLYILDRDACISGGDIMFKRSFLKDEADSIQYGAPQCRHAGLNKEIRSGLTPLGKVVTPKGRLIVFPNSHVHRVTKMINESVVDHSEDVSVVSKRRIVVFFLVNPLRRIVSTREVAPQKGGTMPHEEALEHRLELMKVRKYHKQDWNVREIELCEH